MKNGIHMEVHRQFTYHFDCGENPNLSGRRHIGSIGDSKIMIAEAYTEDNNASGISDTDGSIAEATQDTASPAPEALSNTDARNAHNTAVYLNQQDTHTVTTFDANDSFASLANSSLNTTQVMSYDSSLNNNGVTVSGDEASVTENGVTSSDRMGSALHQSLDGSVLSPEEERLWSIVTANSLDFGAWTALIEETERTSEGNISKIQKVYDAFLVEFPLCYGYWKKYADHEARFSSADKVADVYERAVQGVTYSVDMWLHYCVFAIGTYGDPETIRRLFERALAYVGTDYLCFPLWDKYIEYEISQQDWPRVAAIYTRVLEVPNQQLDRYFEGFKELVANQPLSELQTAEETTASVAISEAYSLENKGEIPPTDVDQSSKAVNTSLKDAEELEKYIGIREEIHKKANDFDSKIAGFETAIRRPYFHVRPLNVAELENWHSYLDYIETGDDFNKVCSYLPNHVSIRQGGSLLPYLGGPPVPPAVVKLYERCLIACANYPEYWIRYVLCMEASGSMELAENALARATQVFVKRQPEIHLFAARFKEQHGDIAGARAAYQLVHTGISPGLLEAIIKHANMEWRLGKLEDACSLYEQTIAIEKGKEQSQTLPMFFAQYSRFIFLVSGNVDKAREILVQGVESAQLSKPLLEAMIHLESIQSHPKRVEYLESLVEKFLVPSPDNPAGASADEREELSSIFLEFLDLFGDAQILKKADNRHFRLFLRHRSTTESKKRHAEDYLVSDRAKFAKSLIPTPASVAGAYSGTPNQWAAGYGAQPQVWPQASQAQAQQWTPGYAPQATYGAYGAYGASYVQPQIPTSVPQSAYGTYPPSYPAQAYAQPASAASLTPAQQPTAAASVPYYTGYY